MTTDSATASNTVAPEVAPENSSYELFVGILSIMSIAVMIWMVFARDPLVHDILVTVDVIFCLIFLLDFARSFKQAPSKVAYMLPRGIIDLLSSLPGFFLVSVSILRFLRFFRVFRVIRIVRRGGPKKLAADFLANREQSAAYLIVLAVILVIMFGSIGAVVAEAGVEGANIKTAGDAVWWAFVTVTTVGYGDRFPVTLEGRLIAVLTMATGIAIFGVVTSILSSFILGGSKDDEESAASPTDVGVAPPQLASEVADLRAEIADLRGLIERQGRTGHDPGAGG